MASTLVQGIQDLAVAMGTESKTKVGSDGTVLKIVQITQSAYTALATKSSTTVYVIVG